jgi:hypothetical protein
MKANGLALNDFDPKDAKGFESVTLRLKNQFEVAHVNTRHLPVDTTLFNGPFEQAKVNSNKNNSPIKSK